ncbi:MAG: polysulfide reductase NrfD [Deltaproteobacteria bacterium]|nr:polysulfide reductase NrfD [Deltaproteobacteria bacterium]
MKAVIPSGEIPRCSSRHFYLRFVPVLILLAWGIYAMLLVWIKGLNQTNMNNTYGFALWIWADLAIIALGGGAFFTGLLTYFFGKTELRSIINFAVLVGVICYSSALLILALDVGQPLRFWFIYWHANVHSMLTEVAFCLTVYFVILNIEYLPALMEHPKLQQIPFFKNLGRNTHAVMGLFAGIGVFLSFFHQGSLGGMTGVLYGRPFAYREGLLIWPWTFFLFTWSAAAAGPCFTLLLARLTEMVSGKKLVPGVVKDLLAKISGWMIITYIVAKTADTIFWATNTAPKAGFVWTRFYTESPLYHGYWILVAEILICGFIPGLILISKRGRHHKRLCWIAVLLVICGVCLNRWSLIMQTVAMPVLPFEKWVFYLPSWQEIATTLIPVSLGIIIIALSYRHLKLFPQEKELN